MFDSLVAIYYIKCPIALSILFTSLQKRLCNTFVLTIHYLLFTIVTKSHDCKRLYT